MEKFSLKRDFKKIMWGPTAQLNGIRVAIAAIVWFIILLCAAEPVGDALFVLYVLPLAFFLFFMPAGLVCGYLASLDIPLVGWGVFLTAFIVIVADPLVFILHKFYPKLIPVDKYSFINFKIVIFVLDDKSQEIELVN